MARLGRRIPICLGRGCRVVAAPGLGLPAALRSLQGRRQPCAEPCRGGGNEVVWRGALRALRAVRLRLKRPSQY